MVNNGQSLLRPFKNFIKIAKMGTRDVQIEEFWLEHNKNMYFSHLYVRNEWRITQIIWKLHPYALFLYTIFVQMNKLWTTLYKFFVFFLSRICRVLFSIKANSDLNLSLDLSFGWCPFFLQSVNITSRRPRKQTSK